MEEILNRIKELEDWKASKEEESSEISNFRRQFLDTARAAGPYSTTVPTADGHVPMLVNGQRFNFLVDKIS